MIDIVCIYLIYKYFNLNFNMILKYICTIYIYFFSKFFENHQFNKNYKLKKS